MKNSHNNNNKKSNLIKNWKKNLTRLFPGRHTNIEKYGQQTYEKMLNFTSYKGNANRNHSKITPHTHYDSCYQKDKK